MKRVVEKSKQTVWVLTMLTVMVVLSAYYLVSEPLVSTDIVTQNTSNNKEGVTADIKIEEIVNDQKLTEEITMLTSDLFVGLKMERDNSRSKQLDNFYTMMQSNISEEAIAGIQDKIEKMQSIEESEFVLEQLIMADGYQDAVVLTNENSVDVIVQSKTLSNTQAVKIIKMVSERLNIPAVNVHIKTVN